MTPLRPGHLEVKVGVVGDVHELCVAWSSQDDVISPAEINYIKVQDLGPKVRAVPKGDWQVDLPNGYRLFPKHDAVEWSSAWSNTRPVDVHGIKGL